MYRVTIFSQVPSHRRGYVDNLTSAGRHTNTTVNRRDANRRAVRRVEARHRGRARKAGDLERGLGRRNVRRGRRGRNRGRPGIRGLVEIGFFFGRCAIDLDRAFEIRAVLNHDARGGQIANDRAILLDFEAVAGTQITLYAAIDDDFARYHVGGQLGCGPHGQLAVIELNEPLDGAVNVQIFIPRNFALDVQTGAQPRG